MKLKECEVAQRNLPHVADTSRIVSNQPITYILVPPLGILFLKISSMQLAQSLDPSNSMKSTHSGLFQRLVVVENITDFTTVNVMIDSTSYVINLSNVVF